MVDSGVDMGGFGLLRDKYGTGESGGLSSSSDESSLFPIEAKIIRIFLNQF